MYKILMKKLEYNETVHQLLIDFNTTCDSDDMQLLMTIREICVL
jgi:hypothetical protein